MLIREQMQLLINSGKILIIDGVDSIGKTTLIDNIKTELLNCGIPTYVVHATKWDLDAAESPIEYYSKILEDAIKLRMQTKCFVIFDRSILTTLFYEKQFSNLSAVNEAALTGFLKCLLSTQIALYCVLTCPVNHWRDRFEKALTNGKDELYTNIEALTSILDKFNAAHNQFPGVLSLNAQLPPIYLKDDLYHKVSTKIISER